MDIRIGIIGLFILLGTVRASAQDSLWESESRTGIRAYEQGQYREAESFFEDAVRQAEEFDKEDPRLASALFNLGQTLAAEGRYSEAQTLLQRSLAIRESLPGPVRPDVSKVLNNLGAIHENEGNYAKAESSYKQAVQISEKASHPNYQALTIALFSLALLYREEGRYPEAESVLRQILSNPKDVQAGRPLDKALVMNGFALAYASQGEYKKAVRLYKQALAMLKSDFGPDHRFLVGPLRDLAKLQLDQGKYGQAERLYQRSLSIVENAYGPDHKEVAVDLCQLASIRYIRHEYLKSEQLYVQAIAILEKQAGSLLYARVLKNLGTVYFAERRYDEAAGILKRVVSIKENSLGPETVDVGRSLSELARAELAGGHYNDAELHCQSALAILELGSPRDYQALIDALNNYFWLLEKTARQDQAELVHTRVIVYRAKLLESEGKR